MTEKYFVGLDMGTTGAKTIIFNMNGEPVGSGYREYGCYYPHPTWVEQDVDEMTVALFETCKDAIADAKINPNDILPLLKDLGVQHHSQPATISITQSTEVGTVYTIAEIKTITNLAHQYGMKVHMDGARISNAAVALNMPFRSFTVDAGIDILSFGGTKNGMMMGEAVLLFNQPSESSIRFVRKQCTQLYSKMRFISAQFLAYFENERWKRNAEHANRMAQLLATELSMIEQVKFTHKTEANGVFISIPSEIIVKLREHHNFYEWDSTPTIRLVTSFDTTEDDVNHFIKTLKKLLK